MSYRPVRIVLVRPRNPKNIGACARAMANFGLTELMVVDPYEPIWKEATSAPGAEALLQEARAVGTWEEAVADRSIILGTSSFHQRPIEHAVIELPNLAKYLSAYGSAEPLAIVFGSERSGLSNEELSKCQAILHIPTEKKVPSMNLGQAVALTLYEMRRGAWDPKMEKEPSASSELEPMIQSIAGLGDKVGYPAGYSNSARLGRVRKAFEGSHLTPATVRFLLSFSRWINKRPAA